MKMKTKMIAAAVAIAVAAPMAPVMASGGGGGGGGGFSGGGVSGERARTPQLSAEQRSFRNGQREFKKAVSCKSCAYPSGITATKQANEVVAKIKNGQIKVKESRKRDLLYYLSQRYRVST